MNLHHQVVIALCAFLLSSHVMASSTCKTMTSIAEIPAGHHPVSATWNQNVANSEHTICYSKTIGSNLRFVDWNGFQAPDGYRATEINRCGQPPFSFCGCKRPHSSPSGPVCLQTYKIYSLTCDKPDGCKNGDGTLSDEARYKKYLEAHKAKAPRMCDHLPTKLVDSYKVLECGYPPKSRRDRKYLHDVSKSFGWPRPCDHLNRSDAAHYGICLPEK